MQGINLEVKPINKSLLGTTSPPLRGYKLARELER